MRKPTFIKTTNRALFLAMQADAMEYPGGISALASAMGMNATTLANGLNPDHDSYPPSFTVIVEIIKIAQARRTIFALSGLIGQVPMEFCVDQKSPEEAISLFLKLVSTASTAFGAGSDFAQDGRFDAKERKELEPMLFALMKATAELMQSLRSH